MILLAKLSGKSVPLLAKTSKLMLLTQIVYAFMDGFRGRNKDEHVVEEKELRDHMTEGQIDDTVEDSFPASDPPATY